VYGGALAFLGGGRPSQSLAAATLWRGSQHLLCPGWVFGAVAFARPRRRRPPSRPRDPRLGWEIKPRINRSF